MQSFGLSPSTVTWDDYAKIYDIPNGYDEIGPGVTTYYDSMAYLLDISFRTKDSDANSRLASLQSIIEMSIIAYLKPKTLLMTGKTGKGQDVFEDDGRTHKKVNIDFWNFLPVHDLESMGPILELESRNATPGQVLFRSKLKAAYGDDSPIWRINWTAVRNITLLAWEFGRENSKTKVLSKLLKKAKPSQMDLSVARGQLKIPSSQRGKQMNDSLIFSGHIISFVDKLDDIRSHKSSELLRMFDLSSSSNLQSLFTRASSAMSSAPASLGSASAPLETTSPSSAFQQQPSSASEALSREAAEQVEKERVRRERLEEKRRLEKLELEKQAKAKNP